MEEALYALLTRVNWYRTRRKSVPLGLALAFNAFADQCDEPNSGQFTRLQTEEAPR